MERAHLCTAGLPYFRAKYGLGYVSVQTHFHWHSHQKDTENNLIHNRAEVCTGRVISYVQPPFTARPMKKEMNMYKFILGQGNKLHDYA